MRRPAGSRVRTTARSTRLTFDADDGPQERTLWQTLMRPSALFCTSLLAFTVVSGIRLWEMGWLDPVIGPRGAGPIESGPIRFAPHARKAAKEYTAPPEPAADTKSAADPEEPAAEDGR